MREGWVCGRGEVVGVVDAASMQQVHNKSSRPVGNGVSVWSGWGCSEGFGSSCLSNPMTLPTSSLACICIDIYRLLLFKSSSIISTTEISSLSK